MMQVKNSAERIIEAVTQWPLEARVEDEDTAKIQAVIRK